MDKWEYSVAILTTGLRKKKDVEDWQEELDEWGNESWELVAVVPMQAQMGFAGSTPQVRCFFKRKK